MAKVGPVRLFVLDVQGSVDWYTRVLGLRVTEEIDFRGHRCVFLRCNTEHHSLALYPVELRDEIGLSPHTTCLSLGNSSVTTSSFATRSTTSAPKPSRSST